jgi:hypothetical protein
MLLGICNGPSPLNTPPPLICSWLNDWKPLCVSDFTLRSSSPDGSGFKTWNPIWTTKQPCDIEQGASTFQDLVSSVSNDLVRLCFVLKDHTGISPNYLADVILPNLNSPGIIFASHFNKRGHRLEMPKFNKDSHIVMWRSSFQKTVDLHALWFWCTCHKCRSQSKDLI